MRTLRFVALTVVVAMCGAAHAQAFVRTPLPSTHPLLGAWHADLTKLKCVEDYVLRADGTASWVSGEARREAEFTISTELSAHGYYKLVDRITKTNGKPDCTGTVAPPDDVAENYVLLHPSGTRFLLCAAEDMNSCFAEFRRKAE